MSTFPRPLAFCCALLFAALTTAVTHAEEVPIDLAETPRIYKSEKVVASVEPKSDGTGTRLNYQFTQVADSLYFRFACPPTDGDIKKITIIAKGTENGIFVSMRDSAAAPHTYAFGPLTEEEQTFEIVPGVDPMSGGGQPGLVQYPVKFIDLLIKMKSNADGYVEVSKIILEASH